MLRLAVVIPTLNAAATLPSVLMALASGDAIEREMVVVDGGSVDGTPDLAESLGARVITASKGRGGQLAAGAAATEAPWLLFLHADTRLQAGWSGDVLAFADDAANRDKAAVFRFALDDNAEGARRLERLVAWRTRVLGLPYGDQGLLVSRALYNDIGGFHALPLMEDVDIVRRLGRARIVTLPSAAETSAKRYQGSYFLRSARNVTCLCLYFVGVPPRWLVRLYG